MRFYEAVMDSLLHQLNDNQTKYEQLISSDDEQSLYNNFGASWQSYLSVSRESLALSRKNLNREATASLRQVSKKLYVNMKETLDNLIELNVISATKASQRGSALNSEFTIILFIILILGGATLAFFLYDLSRKLK